MAVASGLGIVFTATVFGQMHKVAKPEQVVRAVGVYEWTGDEAKPVASRLIPVTLFIDGSLQDAGVYLARPVPLAVDSGTIYEIDHAGVPEGTFDVKFASHLQSPDAVADYDDGWFGYGTFAPPAPPKKVAALKESKTISPIVSSRDEDSDRPTLLRRHDPSSSGDSGTAAGSSGTSTGAAQPSDDPDRPHMTKKPDPATASTPPTGSDSPQSAGSSDSGGTDTSADKTPAGGSKGSTPANDPDRPTLKKRSPEDAKKARKEAEQSSATGLATSLNDDPNRPTLHRGKGQQALTEADLPKLKGLPVGIQQAVAVSDAKDRPPHDFSRPWADDAERATVLAKMQALARARIAAYQAASATVSSTVSSTASSPAKSAPKATANSKARRPVSKQSAPPPVELDEEQLKGYTLSYGGAATYVYTAHTPGDGASLRYVTIVAQSDSFGNLQQPAIQSVTDAAHLDRTPWMRLVDAVDADASNRASLLFEMRGQSARQFALYRVIAARSEQIFVTGTIQ